MNISLTQKMEEWIHDKVASGMYQSASEVVREAIRVVYAYEQRQQTQTLEELRADIQLGMQDVEAGRIQPLDRQLFEDVKTRGRQRLGHIAENELA